MIRKLLEGAMRCAGGFHERIVSRIVSWEIDNGAGQGEVFQSDKGLGFHSAAGGRQSRTSLLRKLSSAVARLLTCGAGGVESSNGKQHETSKAKSQHVQARL